VNARLPHPPEEPEDDGRKFHGWRLLAVIIGVCVVIAVISGVIDWLVIGPLEGRI
jgi:hypothetical protein